MNEDPYNIATQQALVDGQRALVECKRAALELLDFQLLHVRPGSSTDRVLQCAYDDQSLALSKMRAVLDREMTRLEALKRAREELEE